MARPLAIAFCLAALAGAALAGDILIGSPGQAPTRVGTGGALAEDWGSVGFALRCAGSEAVASGWATSFEAGPSASASAACGALSLDVLAYRAPMYPTGADVAEVTLSNPSGAEAAGELVLRAGETLSWGEQTGQAASRAVARLPKGLAPIREPREWGCASGSSRLPGWGRPGVPCDPAYQSIRADFAKEPIIYRFRVKPGSRHQVYVGLLESHWATAGSRPMTLYVEGAPKTVVDPVAEFGQHKPGCLRLEAYDKDGDGYLQVVSASGPEAADLIPILNVVWVFGEDDFLPAEEVMAGKHSKTAEYYVDCGGQADQDLYESGELRFPVKLAAGETRTYPFLFAPSGVSLPAAEGDALTLAALRSAATDVWSDWLGEPGRKLSPEALSAAAFLAFAETQADDYYLVPEEPGGKVGLATHALVAIAYDQVGMRAHAERLLRVLWDPNAPQGLPLGCPNEQGVWADPAGDEVSQAVALFALANHAVTASADWTSRALPTIERVTATLLGAGFDPEKVDVRTDALRAARQVPGLSAALAAKLPPTEPPAVRASAWDGRLAETPCGQAAAALTAP